MTAYGNQQGVTSAPVNGAHGNRACDSSGYAVFSEGDAGVIHVLAHRMLDSNQIERGHRLLGDWLARRHGSGSKWVHLQWHMAVFEVSLGYWQSGFDRFRQHILPAVLTSFDALTDAPAFLWRLSLDAGKHSGLPWEPVRDRALLSLRRSGSPFVNAHHILALAGAGDTDSLDKWIERNTQTGEPRNEGPVIRFARGLRAYITGRYSHAAQELHGITAQFSKIGGSRAQNELFTKLHEAASCKALAGGSHTELAPAA